MLCHNNVQIYLSSFVETPCKFIIAELLIRKLGSSSVLIMSLRIESSAIINLCGVSIKLDKYVVCTMQMYKELNAQIMLNHY